MAKIAFFVEGLTERVLLERVVLEFFAYSTVSLRIFAARGGGASGERRAFLQRRVDTPNPRHEVLIYDCTGGFRVLSEVRERFPLLCNTGYSLVVAVLDLHPTPLSDRERVQTIRQRTLAPLVTLRCRAELLQCVHEVETVFLSDEGLLPRMHGGITTEALAECFGAAWVEGKVDEISGPASRLDEIMRTIGRRYQKSEGQIRAFVEALDVVRVYVEGTVRSPTVAQLFGLLEAVA